MAYPRTRNHVDADKFYKDLSKLIAQARTLGRGRSLLNAVWRLLADELKGTRLRVGTMVHPRDRKRL